MKRLRDKIITMIEDGYSIVEIMKKLGCSKEAVRLAKSEIEHRKSLTDFQNRFSLRVSLILARNGIKTEEDWHKAVKSGEYLKFRNLGIKSIEEVESKCEIERKEDGEDTDSDDQSGRV